MAEDEVEVEPRRPTIEDFRAILAAGRLFEARIRPTPGCARWAAHDAYSMALAICRHAGLEAGVPPGLPFVEHLVVDAARDVFRAVAATAAHLELERLTWLEAGAPAPDWPDDIRLGVGADGRPVADKAADEVRATLRATLDALAAGVDLAEVATRMTTEDQELIREAVRQTRRTAAEVEELKRSVHRLDRDGMQGKDIAKQWGISAGRVSQILNEPPPDGL